MTPYTILAGNAKYSLTPFCFLPNPDGTISILSGHNPRDLITTLSSAELIPWLMINHNLAHVQRKVASLETATQAGAMLADLGL